MAQKRFAARQRWRSGEIEWDAGDVDDVNWKEVASRMYSMAEHELYQNKRGGGYLGYIYFYGDELLDEPLEYGLPISLRVGVQARPAGIYSPRTYMVEISGRKSEADSDEVRNPVEWMAEEFESLFDKRSMEEDIITEDERRKEIRRLIGKE